MFCIKFIFEQNAGTLVWPIFWFEFRAVDGKSEMDLHFTAHVFRYRVAPLLQRAIFVGPNRAD